MKRKTHRKTTVRMQHNVTSDFARKAAIITTLIIGAVLVFLFLVTGKTASAVDAAADVTIGAAISPNTNSTTTSSEWTKNAINSIQTGALAAGDPALPSYYKELASDETVDPHKMISTNFPSWYGLRNPGTVFGPAFAFETGNTLRFVYMFKAKPATKIDIANGVTFSVKPNAWKPAGVGPITYTEYLSTMVYPNILVGIDYGPDGQLGGDDDTVRTSGTGPVDVIVGTFTTFSELSEVAASDPQNPQEQAVLTEAIDKVTALGWFENTFQIKYGTDPVAELVRGVGVPPLPTATPTPISEATPTPAIAQIGIDIRPNSYKNMLNLKSRGLVGVAVLSSSTVNPKDVDSDTVLFAGASPVRVNMRDVNRDRIRDMVLYFKIADLHLDSTMTSATLTGKLKNGTMFSGTDSITMVPKIEEVEEHDLED